MSRRRRAFEHVDGNRRNRSRPTIASSNASLSQLSAANSAEELAAAADDSQFRFLTEPPVTERKKPEAVLPFSRTKTPKISNCTAANNAKLLKSTMANPSTEASTSITTSNRQTNGAKSRSSRQGRSSLEMNTAAVQKSSSGTITNRNDSLPLKKRQRKKQEEDQQPGNLKTSHSLKLAQTIDSVTVRRKKKKKKKRFAPSTLQVLESIPEEDPSRLSTSPLETTRGSSTEGTTTGATTTSGNAAAFALLSLSSKKSPALSPAQSQVVNTANQTEPDTSNESSVSARLEADGQEICPKGDETANVTLPLNDSQRASNDPGPTTTSSSASSLQQQSSSKDASFFQTPRGKAIRELAIGRKTASLLHPQNDLTTANSTTTSNILDAMQSRESTMSNVQTPSAASDKKDNEEDSIEDMELVDLEHDSLEELPSPDLKEIRGTAKSLQEEENRQGHKSPVANQEDPKTPIGQHTSTPALRSTSHHAKERVPEETAGFRSKSSPRTPPKSTPKRKIKLNRDFLVALSVSPQVPGSSALRKDPLQRSFPKFPKLSDGTKKPNLFPQKTPRKRPAFQVYEDHPDKETSSRDAKDERIGQVSKSRRKNPESAVKKSSRDPPGSVSQFSKTIGTITLQRPETATSGAMSKARASPGYRTQRDPSPSVGSTTARIPKDPPQQVQKQGISKALLDEIRESPPDNASVVRRMMISSRDDAAASDRIYTELHVLCSANKSNHNRNNDDHSVGSMSDVTFEEIIDGSQQEASKSEDAGPEAQQSELSSAERRICDKAIGTSSTLEAKKRGREEHSSKVECLESKTHRKASTSAQTAGSQPSPSRAEQVPSAAKKQRCLPLEDAFSRSSSNEDNQRSVYETLHHEFIKEQAGEMKHNRTFSPPSPYGPNRQNVHATSLGDGNSSPNPDSPDVWTAELAGQVNVAPVFRLCSGRYYRHPPLPPGWSLRISHSRDRPYYHHPDFGTTFYAPVPLPTVDGKIMSTRVVVVRTPVSVQNFTWSGEGIARNASDDVSSQSSSRRVPQSALVVSANTHRTQFQRETPALATIRAKSNFSPTSSRANLPERGSSRSDTERSDAFYDECATEAYDTEQTSCDHSHQTRNSTSVTDVQLQTVQSNLEPNPKTANEAERPSPLGVETLIASKCARIRNHKKSPCSDEFEKKSGANSKVDSPLSPPRDDESKEGLDEAVPGLSQGGIVEEFVVLHSSQSSLSTGSTYLTPQEKEHSAVSVTHLSKQLAEALSASRVPTCALGEETQREVHVGGEENAPPAEVNISAISTCTSSQRAPLHFKGGKLTGIIESAMTPRNDVELQSHTCASSRNGKQRRSMPSSIEVVANPGDNPANSPETNLPMDDLDATMFPPDDESIGDSSGSGCSSREELGSCSRAHTPDSPTAEDVLGRFSKISTRFVPRTQREVEAMTDDRSLTSANSHAFSTASSLSRCSTRVLEPPMPVDVLQNLTVLPASKIMNKKRMNIAKRPKKFSKSRRVTPQSALMLLS